MIDIGIFLTLLALGYFFGSAAERRHFKSILEREQLYRDVLTFSARFPPEDLRVKSADLVVGNVVVSVDYFKSIAAGLRSFFGGKITSFESLIERARREAILRMKAQAKKQGADMVFNVKLETASITKGQRDQVGAVEVYAYGTALKTV